MEAQNSGRTLPAFAAIGIITVFVLLSIFGYLILSGT
jgi:hypothetical protein